MSVHLVHKQVEVLHPQSGQPRPILCANRPALFFRWATQLRRASQERLVTAMTYGICYKMPNIVLTLLARTQPIMAVSQKSHYMMWIMKVIGVGG